MAMELVLKGRDECMRAAAFLGEAGIYAGCAYVMAEGDENRELAGQLFMMAEILWSLHQAVLSSVDRGVRLDVKDVEEKIAAVDSIVKKSTNEGLKSSWSVVVGAWAHALGRGARRK